MGCSHSESFAKDHGDLAQGKLEWCRRLSDGEILAVQRDAPQHLFYTLSAWFRYHSPVDSGYSAVQRAANSFIEENKLDATTQRIFWAAVERMATIYKATIPDASQLPLL